MYKKVIILSFSSRKNGNCTKISDYLTEKFKRTNVLSFVIESTYFAPCGGCNYECLTPCVICPQLSDQQIIVMDAICSSDLVYYVIPNYCGYPCGNYFAFNERSVGYFNTNRELMNRYMSVPKRFIIVSNTEDDNFVNAMRQQTEDTPNILYIKTGKYGKRSTAGDLLESEAARADLDAYLAADLL